MKFSQQAVVNYKSVSDEIWHGNLYRLMSPRENDLASLMYVNKDKSKALMFNYLVNNRFGAGSILPIKLKGLQADKKYSVKGNKSLSGYKIYFKGRRGFFRKFFNDNWF